ncbi:M14 family zinc carboxypeptidase [Emticicia sp. W12TSBA100-4]|uniref:M14 family zinc carboxypeptidase n=1 Tax=Emticicia sp. W12TSBA100-4 TaxID=3160965 RepID=UPI003306464F
MVVLRKRFTFVLSVIITFLTNMSAIAQPKLPDFSKQLFDSHEQIKEQSLIKRRFKHKDIVPLIEKLPFSVEKAGKSFEERDIYQIKMGSGKTKVLLWSQMHGDEATATMALFDIFNFFQGKNDGFDALRSKILENCTLYYVPMLNPDGAERFQRRTATDIDMNRDALSFQTPEGRILKKLQDELKPEFSFNLHDKNTKYSAGASGKQATISFLPTSYNYAKEWNPARTRAMQVICGMHQTLQQFIPGHLGRWNDDHEPRAFGDNIAKWGSSLILIESGGYKEDIEKQFIRKLNFVAILTGLQAIAEQSYTNFELKTYEAIPNNDRYIFDLLIRNAEFVHNGKTIIKDIGINLSEKNINNATDFVLSSVIEDLGDLSTFWGLKEIDAKGLRVSKLSEFPQVLQKYKVSENEVQNQEINLDETASFLLTKDKEVKYIILNGQIK